MLRNLIGVLWIAGVLGVFYFIASNGGFQFLAVLAVVCICACLMAGAIIWISDLLKPELNPRHARREKRHHNDRAFECTEWWGDRSGSVVGVMNETCPICTPKVGAR